MKQTKISPDKYNKIMDKKMKEMKGLQVHEQLIEMVNLGSQYEITDEKAKDTKSICGNRGK